MTVSWTAVSTTDLLSHTTKSTNNNQSHSFHKHQVRHLTNITVSKGQNNEAQLSQRDCTMRYVSWNRHNCVSVLYHFWEAISIFQKNLNRPSDQKTLRSGVIYYTLASTCQYQSAAYLIWSA